jgi:putative hydrolase of the HAD superfamily
MNAVSPFPPFKVMTFDVVGTLIDFEKGMLDYLRQSGAASPDISNDAILDAYRNSRRQKADRYPDDLERCYFELVRVLGLKDDIGLARGFRDSVEFWPAFPDSAAALANLGTRYRLVAMTNAQRWAFEYFNRTLGNPFWDSVTVDEVLCEKPDPVFFAFARGRLSGSGYAQHEILHVAQSQYHDIRVAKGLGYTTCWIERRQGFTGFGGTLAVETLTKPDFHYTTLVELAETSGRN